jgi:hypothetical protein
MSESQISRIIGQLADSKYIFVEVEENHKRKITLNSRLKGVTHPRVEGVTHGGLHNNINNNNKKGEKKISSYKTVVYDLDKCSAGVRYVCDKLGLKPTDGLINLIDNRFGDYSISFAIDSILLWCEDNQKDPANTNRVARWLQKELENGTLPKKSK